MQKDLFEEQETFEKNLFNILLDKEGKSLTESKTIPKFHKSGITGFFQMKK